MWAYFDAPLNDMVYQLPKLFPTPRHENVVIVVPAGPSARDFAPLMYGELPALTPNGGNQCYPRYTWHPINAADGAINVEALAAGESDDEPVIIDGYRRVDNITDATLAAYRTVYADPGITKDDIFYYVYGVLHHSEYRERYAADLKKQLPRIPHLHGFHDIARIGRALAELHLGYESVPAHPGLHEQLALGAPADAYERYRIEKLAWAGRSKTHRTGIRYNEWLTIEGIPPEANEYKVGGRSPLEWVIDRYRVTTDKASGIVNDPNDWLSEQHKPRYVVDLIGSLVTLSLETQQLVAELPPFAVLDGSTR